MAERRWMCGLAALVLAALSLTGCWDRIEINNRGFVVGVSVDEAPQQEDGEGQGTSPPFRICYQLVVPGGQTGGSDSSRGSTGYSNLCAEAANLSAFHQYATDKLSRPPFYDHLKVVVISDKVAKQGRSFSDALDFFLRSANVRRSIKILVARGQASNSLNAKSPNEDLPASDLEKIAGTGSSLDKPPASTIGYIHERLMNETSFVVQSLASEGESVRFSGCAIFDGRTNRHVGALDARQTIGRNLLLGFPVHGTLGIKSGASVVSFSFYDIRRRLHADVRDPQRIVFDVAVSVTVSVGEVTGPQLDLSDSAMIARLQADAKTEIEALIDDTVTAVRRDIRKDALGLGEFLKRNHYRTWRKIAGNWDEGDQLMSRCVVNVRANVSIRQIGIVDMSQRI